MLIVAAWSRLLVYFSLSASLGWGIPPMIALAAGHFPTGKTSSTRGSARVRAPASAPPRRPSACRSPRPWAERRTRHGRASCSSAPPPSDVFVVQRHVGHRFVVRYSSTSTTRRFIARSRRSRAWGVPPWHPCIDDANCPSPYANTAGADNPRSQKRFWRRKLKFCHARR